MKHPPILIDLRASLGMSIVDYRSREEIEAALARPAAVRVDLATWRHLNSSDSSPPVGLIPGLKAVLDRAGPDDAFVLFHTTFRERHGGRRYCYYAPDHRGHIALSHGSRERLDRKYPQFVALPRVLRGAIVPPPGHLFIDVDIRTCFPSIGAAFSKDARLVRDLEGDVHQLVGDAALPGQEASARRLFGKVLNNSLVGGMTPHGLDEDFQEAGYGASLERAQQWWDWWWDRYPQFRSWVDGCLERQREAARRNATFHVITPTRTISFSPAKVRGWARDRKYLDPAAAERSIVSSYFRGIEGSILDCALMNLATAPVEFGLRLVLPTYDGFLAAVPERFADWGSDHAAWAVNRALLVHRVKTEAIVQTGPSWGDLQAP